MGRHTPGCEITWTEVGFAEMRDVMQQDRPLQLRFGVHLDPAIWDRSFQVVVEFLLLRRDTFAWVDSRVLATATLPGKPVADIWLARGFAHAWEVAPSGFYVFRPHIWFMQSSSDGYVPGEFAVGDDHHFVTEMGGAAPDRFPPPEFTGGSGRPGDS